MLTWQLVLFLGAGVILILMSFWTGQQLEALEKLRSAGPEAIGRLCGLIAMGSAWLGKDPEARAKLRELLGVDVDLERAEAQCRAGQDTIASELTTAIARLKAELLRCDDTI
jgi:hypothetical protein